MRIETSVDVDAPGDVLWMVLLDVEAWPRLTASMDEVTKTEEGALVVGSSVWIKQPRLPRTEWIVTELTPHSRFVWEAHGPGVRTVATHEIVDATADSSQLRLVVEQAGAMGGVFGRLTAGLTRKYIDKEAAGLKRKAESLA